MIRSFINKVLPTLKKSVNWTTVRSHGHGPSAKYIADPFGHAHGEEDDLYINYLSKDCIDGWEVRRAGNEILGSDAIPHPDVVCAFLNACRRINDYALCVRFLEATKHKCGPSTKVLYPWVINEVRPLLCDLGISTPEELGYDTPELALVPTHAADLRRIERERAKDRSKCNTRCT